MRYTLGKLNGYIDTNTALKIYTWAWFVPYGKMLARPGLMGYKNLKTAMVRRNYTLLSFCTSRLTFCPCVCTEGAVSWIEPRKNWSQRMVPSASMMGKAIDLPHIERFRWSLVYYSPEIWNSLPDSCKEKLMLECLKKNVKRYFQSIFADVRIQLSRNANN